MTPAEASDDPLALHGARAFLTSVGEDAASFELRIDAADAQWRHITAMKVPARHLLTHYLREAREAAVFLERMLRSEGRSYADLGALLDFASGSGRVTRHFLKRMDAARVDASDILPETIPFLRDVLGVGAFPSSHDPAAVRFPREYDLIFVGSLFTHLPRERFESWLRRLRDALKPGGLLVFTTHGPAIAEQHGVARDPFAFVEKSEIAQLDAGEYGSTYVAPDLVRALLANAGFPEATVRERGLWDIQDAWIVRKDGTPPPAPPPAPARGGLTAFSVTPGIDSTVFEVEGFADLDPAAPALVEIACFIDGGGGERASLLPATSILDVYGEARRRTPWRLVGALPPLPYGQHVATFVAVSADGVREYVAGGVSVF